MDDITPDRRIDLHGPASQASVRLGLLHDFLRQPGLRQHEILVAREALNAAA